MYTVIVSTVSTGRVVRKSFDTLEAAEGYLDHIENVRRRFDSGLSGVRVEIETGAKSQPLEEEAVRCS